MPTVVGQSGASIMLLGVGDTYLSKRFTKVTLEGTSHASIPHNLFSVVVRHLASNCSWLIS